MYRIGIIGDKDSIMGFKALGLEVFPVVEAAEAMEIMDNLVKEHFAIIFVTEQIVEKSSHIMEKHKDKALPVVIPVPGNGGTLGIGMQKVRESVEKAVGADILFKGN